MQQDDLARGLADARLDRGAVALVVGMAHHPRPRRRGALRGAVGGAVVHDQDLAPGAARGQAAPPRAPIPSSSLKAGMTTETVAAAQPRAVAASRELGLAHAVEQVLEELAVAGDEVGHDPPLQGLEAEDQQEHGQDRRLQVAADVAQPQKYA